MKPKIIFQEIENCSPTNHKKQRLVAHFLLSKLTGEKISHSETGRPIINSSVDVSISHKNDLVCVGTVPHPYKIGVDIEHTKTKINAPLFFESVITKTEAPFLKIFCKNSHIPLSSGVAIFWSIKEAFFKCLDYDLKPGKINVLNIHKNNRIEIGYSNEIEELMKKRKLKLCFAKMTFNKKHIRSQVVMRDLS